MTAVMIWLIVSGLTPPHLLNSTRRPGRRGSAPADRTYELVGACLTRLVCRSLNLVQVRQDRIEAPRVVGRVEERLPVRVAHVRRHVVAGGDQHVGSGLRDGRGRLEDWVGVGRALVRAERNARARPDLL